MNLRELALDSLLEIEKEGLRLNTVVHGTLDKYSYLPKQERAFYSRLTKGCLEWQIFEDYVIDQFSKIKVKKMKPLIRWVLRMGVYQAYFMDSVPESAICNEAVNLTRAKGKTDFPGLLMACFETSFVIFQKSHFRIKRRHRWIIFPSPIPCLFGLPVDFTSPMD